MATFNEILTTKGEQLFAKALSGNATITFTKIVMGDGEVSAALRKNLNDVVHPVKTLNIESVIRSSDNVINIKSIFTNENLTNGFYFREKGVYATDGTTEVLFIYGNNGSLSEWIQAPDNSVIEKIISSIITFSESDEINVTLQSGIYATKEDLEETNQKVNEAFLSASNGKQAIKNAITGVDDSVVIPTDATFQQLADAISQIETGVDTEDATAIASQILADMTAYIKEVKVTGTMPNNGSIGTQNLATQNAEYTIPIGYHNGLGKVKAVITGLIASVIKAGTTVGGILGTFTSDATAIASQMLAGVTAYVNGVKITGTIASKAAATITPSTVNQTIAANQFLSGIQTILGDGDLVTGNIRGGSNIFNVPGKASVVETAGAGAIASQLLSGCTAFVNGVMLTGTIPVTMADLGDSIQGGNGIAYAGYVGGVNFAMIQITPNSYLGNANWLRWPQPDLYAANILAGKTIMNVAGTAIAGKRYATGTVTAGATAITLFFATDSYGGDSRRPLAVSGLTFLPSAIIIRGQDSTNQESVAVYNTKGTFYAKVVSCLVHRIDLKTNDSTLHYLYKGDQGGVSVYNGGFVLPCPGVTSITYTWEAWE